MEQIMSQRTMNDADPTVVYDLSVGFDFADLKSNADNLANVLFEQDVKKWIVFTGKTFRVEPKYNATIIVPQLEERQIQKFSDRLWRNIYETILQTESGQFFNEKIKQSVMTVTKVIDPLSTYTLRKRVVKAGARKLVSEIEKNVKILAK